MKLFHSSSLYVVGSICIMMPFVLTACVPNQQQEQSLKQLQSQVSVLSNEVQGAFEKTEQEQIEQYEALNDEVKVLQRNQADLVSTTGELQTTLAAIEAKLDEYNQRMIQLSEHLDVTETLFTERITLLADQLSDIRRQSGRTSGTSASRQPAATPTPVETSPVEEPRQPSQVQPQQPQQQAIEPEASQFYHKAYTAYVNGDFERAVEGFTRFIQLYPETSLTDIAQFWIAESYFSMGEYTTALQEYDALINQYPDSDKVPAAFFSKADAYLKLDRQIEAISHLKYIVNRFPSSKAAQKASERLKALGE